METLNIIETKVTPAVYCDSVKQIISFSGRSLPDEAASFYQPIVKWIEEFEPIPESILQIEFKLDYLNTSSSKWILDILYKIEKLRYKNISIDIKWFYPANDEEWLLRCVLTHVRLHR